ncbi:DUF4287 domain-containing protein [Candidatus Kapabacteria bacterium]|nr:DUF4287 domain-containing protein [Candidatus Kapabacteria bacterium]
MSISTMIDNLHKNTGKTLEQWIEIVKKQKISKHGEIIKFLKEEHKFTHGFANLVAHKTNESDAGSVRNTDELITKQYNGKEHLVPIYDKLILEINNFDGDFEIAPKNSYVSLKRKKQFATLKPATKNRFDLGLNLKGKEAKGKLIGEKANSMCSHKISLNTIEDIDKEVIDWLRIAFENSK